MRNTPIRVVTGKIGLDGHDRGIKVVSMALSEAGMEVIYVGMRLSADQVARAVADEDAQVLAVNFAGADHLELVPRMMAALEKAGSQPRSRDPLVIIGGIIPDADIPLLKKMGIAEVFLPGTPLAEIERFVRTNAPRRGQP